MKKDLFLGVKFITTARQLEIPVIGPLAAQKATRDRLADALPVETKTLAENIEAV